MTVTVNGGTFSGNQRARGVKATTAGNGALTLTVEENGTYVSTSSTSTSPTTRSGGLTFSVLDDQVEHNQHDDGTRHQCLPRQSWDQRDIVGTISNDTIDNDDALATPRITALAHGVRAHDYHRGDRQHHHQVANIGSARWRAGAARWMDDHGHHRLADVDRHGERHLRRVWLIAHHRYQRRLRGDQREHGLHREFERRPRRFASVTARLGRPSTARLSRSRKQRFGASHRSCRARTAVLVRRPPTRRTSTPAAPPA